MRLAPRLVFVLCTVVISGNSAQTGHGAEPQVKPVFREFMGLNVHTVQFKPDLYKPIAQARSRLSSLQLGRR